MKKGEKRDMGSIRLNSETSPEQFVKFCAAIDAARRLGFNVKLRVYSGMIGGCTIPIDVHAVAYPKGE